MIDRASIMAWNDILLRAGADKFDPQRAYAMVKESFIPNRSLEYKPIIF